MPGPSFVAIVASLHGQVGKTLLARTLTDYFVLSGGKPYIFDTDPVERGLHALFPAEARVIDLVLVRDQMLLFDTLAKPSPQMRIVDTTHRSLTTFFELLRGTDVIAEARSHGIELAIFYIPIPDRRADSFEAGVILRDNFRDCAFIVVDNAFLKEPKRSARQGASYKALRAHNWRFAMPKLADQVVEALEDYGLSLGNFMCQPMSSNGEAPVPDNLTPELRIALRTWVFRMFQEIYRLTHALATHEEPVAANPVSPWDPDPEAWEETRTSSLEAVHWAFADEGE
jgi:hypothetical protein